MILATRGRERKALTHSSEIGQWKEIKVTYPIRKRKEIVHEGSAQVGAAATTEMLRAVCSVTMKYW
jgi:hypothetical protein